MANIIVLQGRLRKLETKLADLESQRTSTSDTHMASLIEASIRKTKSAIEDLKIDIASEQLTHNQKAISKAPIIRAKIDQLRARATLLLQQAEALEAQLNH